MSLDRSKYTQYAQKYGGKASYKTSCKMFTSKFKELSG